jgi:hypothetical protein
MFVVFRACFLFLFVIVLFLMFRQRRRLFMGHRPNFWCQDWRSHPQGSVFTAKILSVPCEKPVERTTIIQCRATSSLETVWAIINKFAAGIQLKVLQFHNTKKKFVSDTYSGGCCYSLLPLY